MLPVVVDRMVFVHRGVGVSLGHGLTVGVLIHVMAMLGVLAVVGVWPGAGVILVWVVMVGGVHACSFRRGPSGGAGCSGGGQAAGV